MATQKYWFKRRRYGYGWTPTSKQGWSVLLIYLVIVIASVFFIPAAGKNELTTEIVLYLCGVGALTLALIAISYAKGPKPKWRWGAKPTDNPDEDY